MAENIYPIYDQMMSRADKEALLCQRGMMVWFTGLSGSGKSTIAMGVEREAYSAGYWTATISEPESTVTWVSHRKTGRRISVALRK